MAERPFEFTVRPAEEWDRQASVDLFKRSQAATGIPDPRFVPPELLEERLYDGFVIRRYIADHNGRVVGHALIERPNPLNVDDWAYGTELGRTDMLELGREFVDPNFTGHGVWTELLRVRLGVVRQAGKVAVAATWFQNVHVMRTFERLGGVNVGDKSVADGIISMYRFDDTGETT